MILLGCPKSFVTAAVINHFASVTELWGQPNSLTWNSVLAFFASIHDSIPPLKLRMNWRTPSLLIVLTPFLVAQCVVRGRDGWQRSMYEAACPSRASLPLVPFLLLHLFVFVCQILSTCTVSQVWIFLRHFFFWGVFFQRKIKWCWQITSLPSYFVVLIFLKLGVWFILF